MKCRKVFAVLCIIALIFTAGCGNNTSSENSTDENVAEESSKSEIAEDISSENKKDEDLSEEKVNENNKESSADVESDNKADNEVSIIMVGDMLLHDRVEEVSTLADGSYDFSPIFENTKDDIANADLAIANQEVILGGSELGISGYPAFNGPYEFADELVETGFDIICHGTNHALDKGASGITNCLNYWKTNYPEIGVLGIHDSAEDQNEIYVTEVNGIKIAVLNYTYGTNGISLPENMPYAVDYLSENRLINDLKEAEEKADFTIVCPHWGTEYSLIPDSSQEKWAQIMVDNGADLIIGTHPHVIEPIEWIDSNDGENKALCYYSLGNYVNWTSGEGEGVSNRMVGGMAQVTLTLDDAGKVTISEYNVTPLVSHVTSEKGGVTVYKLEEYTDELAKENEIISQASDFSLEYCNNLVEEVWGEILN